jgi:hypothetical protein
VHAGVLEAIGIFETILCLVNPYHPTLERTFFLVSGSIICQAGNKQLLNIFASRWSSGTAYFIQKLNEESNVVTAMTSDDDSHNHN